MDTPERDLRILILSKGKAPFKDWLRWGNFGDYQSVGDGVFELRVFDR